MSEEESTAHDEAERKLCVVVLQFRFLKQAHQCHIITSIGTWIRISKKACLF